MVRLTFWKTTRYAAKTASKAITGMSRWANTDHLGTAKLRTSLPPMSLVDTLGFFLIHILFAILGGVLSGLWVYVLLAHGIPCLLGA